MKKQTFRMLMLDGISRTGVSIAELARRSGVSYDAINKLKRREGATTSAENARAIAAVLDFEWDGNRDAGQDAEPDAEALIPVYDVEASAGNGSVVEAEPVVAHMALSREYLRDVIGEPERNLKVIKVQGHSMEPTLNHGDLVMIDITKRDLNYDGLFVVRFGDALQVKRIGRSPQRGHIELISDNPAYGRRDWSMADLEPVGRVLWVGRRV